MTDKATMPGVKYINTWSDTQDAEHPSAVVDADKYDSLAAVAGRLCAQLEKQAKLSDVYLDETGEAINAYNALMKGR